MRKFWRTKPVEPEEVPDMLPPREIRSKIDVIPVEEGSESKQIFAKYLKTVTRVQLMEIQDSVWYKEHLHHDWICEAADDREWELEWPIGKYGYTQRIPDIVRDTLPIKTKATPSKRIDLDNIVTQVEGMQKKLDLVARLLEDNEITMSGKTALGLVGK